MERSGNCDPYLDYKCLDAHLGDDFSTRFYRYYALEWGHAAAPSDPKALPSRRSDTAWHPTPQSTPPMPFTEWPYGGTTAIGVTRPNSVDSPLMVALANTQLGAGMSASHVHIFDLQRVMVWSGLDRRRKRTIAMCWWRPPPTRPISSA